MGSSFIVPAGLLVIITVAVPLVWLFLVVNQRRRQYSFARAVEECDVERVKGILKQQPSIVQAWQEDAVNWSNLASWKHRDGSVLKQLPKIVHLLAENGTNFDCNLSGMYSAPLIAALSKNNYALAELLLENGANPNIRRNDKWLLLHLIEHDDEFATKLVEYGARPDVTDDEGNTPLHQLSYSGMASSPRLVPILVDLLIKAGADVQAKNRAGDSPLAYANKYGRTIVVKTLLERSVQRE